MQANSPCATKSTIKAQNLVKINSTKSNKKKKLFDELSFVENHVDTFYVGLNEKVTGVDNPVQAKVIEIEQAQSLLKNWVHPETQLVKSTSKNSAKKILSNQTIERGPSRIKPLKFINDEPKSKKEKPPKDKKTPNVIIQQNDNDHDDYDDYNKNALDNNQDLDIKTSELLKNLFDDTTTHTPKLLNDKEQQEQQQTPTRHTIYVDDTPVAYYGVSVIERRKRGLKF